jgi:hypothetical protein
MKIEEKYYWLGIRSWDLTMAKNGSKVSWMMTMEVTRLPKPITGADMQNMRRTDLMFI